MDEMIGLLSTAAEGLTVTELRQRLSGELSQPTVWRHLAAMRGLGLVTVEGRARATRYHATARARLPELRSRRLHEGVARRLARNPDLRALARARMRTLRTVNPHGRAYHDRWDELLDGPLPRLLQTMTEDSEQANAMRKESPFTTLVDPDERRRIFTALRAA